MKRDYYSLLSDPFLPLFPLKHFKLCTLFHHIPERMLDRRVVNIRIIRNVPDCLSQVVLVVVLRGVVQIQNVLVAHGQQGNVAGVDSLHADGGDHLRVVLGVHDVVDHGLLVAAEELVEGFVGNELRAFSLGLH